MRTDEGRGVIPHRNVAIKEKEIEKKMRKIEEKEEKKEKRIEVKFMNI